MKSNYKLLGDFIRQVDVRNVDMITDRVLGINIDKYFMPSVANVIGTDLRKYKLLHNGLFACNPMHVGRDERLPVALYNEDTPAIVSPAYFMFQICEKKILNEDFLMMWFRRPEFDRQCWLKTDGSVRGGITWNDICRLEIPIIPYQEQLNIVKQYKTIADRIALKQRINDTLIDMLQSNYKKMLNGYTPESETIPANWKVGRIGDYCDVKSGYAFKSEWWTKEGVRVIKIANIVNNTIAIDDCDCVAEEHTLNATKFLVKSGDVLIAMTGATTGKVGIVPYVHNPLVVNQRVGKFFLGDTPLERAPYLFSTLLSDNVSRQLRPDGTAGSAQDNLSPDDIKNIVTIFPEAKTIERYNNKNISYIKMLTVTCSEIMFLKKILNVILQRISS